MNEQIVDVPLPVESQWSVVRGCLWRVLASLAGGLSVGIVISFFIGIVGAASHSDALLHLPKEFLFLEILTILSMLMTSAVSLYFARDELKERFERFLPDLRNGLRRPVSLLILVCVPLALFNSDHWGMTTSQQARTFLHGIPPIYWLAFALPVVIVGPLAEEIFFRGYVWDRLSGVMPPWKVGVVSAALFLGFHLPNGIRAPLLVLPVTIILTVLRLRRVGVGVCILTHCVYNGTIVLNDFAQTYGAPLHIP